jgi:carbon monoxide dehydrogenase subunit G
MELSFRLKKKPDIVFSYLTDMEKFVSVHPVISKYDNIGRNNFLVYETLNLGFIPFSFCYPVTIEKKEDENEVTMHARVMKVVTIQMKFVLKNEGDFTLVKENIQINSHLPIKYLMETIFKKQHWQLFKNIEIC